MPWLKEIGHPRRHRRLPAVLTVDEVGRVLQGLTGEHLLLARLLYGTGLRIAKALQLRVKDVDFGLHALTVREGKGAKDRVVMSPQSLAAALRVQLAQARLAAVVNAVVAWNEGQAACRLSGMGCWIGFSGFRWTSSMRVQFRVAPDQRRGWRALAAA